MHVQCNVCNDCKYFLRLQLTDLNYHRQVMNGQWICFNYGNIFDDEQFNVTADLLTEPPSSW